MAFKELIICTKFYTLFSHIVPLFLFHFCFICPVSSWPSGIIDYCPIFATILCVHAFHSFQLAQSLALFINSCISGSHAVSVWRAPSYIPCLLLTHIINMYWVLTLTLTVCRHFVNSLTASMLYIVIHVYRHHFCTLLSITLLIVITFVYCLCIQFITLVNSLSSSLLHTLLFSTVIICLFSAVTICLFSIMLSSSIY